MSHVPLSTHHRSLAALALLSGLAAMDLAQVGAANDAEQMCAVRFVHFD